MTKRKSPESPFSPEDEYFLEIESHFAARRGTPFLFSSKDWALMKGWRDDSIPIAVVIEAIDQCFDKREKAGRKRTISSLSYCRHAVRELWDERKALQVGAEGSVPELDPMQQVDGLAASLRRVASEIETEPIAAELRACADGLHERAKGKSVPQIEETLSAIEHELLNRLSAALPHDQSRQIDDEIASMLERFPIEDEGMRAKTHEANFRRLLRRRLGLPRLSLFG